MTQGSMLGSASASVSRIYGSGEMADRIRAYDWTTTSLGPIEQWPGILVTTLNLLLASRQPMFLWWGDDLIQFYNDAYRPSIGKDKHPSALGQRGAVCWPEIWYLIKPMIDEVMQNGKATWSEDQLIPIYRDGILTKVYWTFSYSPVRDLEGAIRGTCVVASDTSRRILAEQRLNNMLNAATDGVVTIAADWSIEDVNANGQRILGHAAAHGASLWKLIPETAPTATILRDAMTHRVPGTFEISGLQPRHAWYLINVRPTGEAGITLFFTDISARKATEQAVVMERARLLDILRQAPAFFALLRGPDHIISMVNPLYLRLINQSDVIIGTPLREVLPQATAQQYIDILDRVYAGERVVGYDARYQAFGEADGQPEERYVNFAYQPLREIDDTISGIILLGVDVTDRKKAQEVLLETEKLAAVGRLAGSIAHEINNPLESVTNLLYLVRSMNSSPEINEYLEMADRELRRVSAITNQTLRFHKQASNPLECTGEQLATGVLALYQGRIVSSKIHFEARYRDRSAVRCFEGEIRQVINNLIGNALDAMSEDGGRLLVRSREGEDHGSGRRGLIITVADTGPGMSKSVQQQAFRPFFTTKGFVGTGLGLWICREIVIRHEGKLLLRSSQRPGCSGTVISFFLPFEAVSR